MHGRGLRSNLQDRSGDAALVAAGSAHDLMRNRGHRRGLRGNLQLHSGGAALVAARIAHDPKRTMLRTRRLLAPGAAPRRLRTNTFSIFIDTKTTFVIFIGLKSTFRSGDADLRSALQVRGGIAALVAARIAHDPMCTMMRTRMLLAPGAAPCRLCTNILGIFTGPKNTFRIVIAAASTLQLRAPRQDLRNQ